jgi:hypothetical protein
MATLRQGRLLARLRGDRGALTLSYVIILPSFLLVIMIMAQGAVWFLARSTALAAARQGADAARVAQAPPGAGPGAAVAFAEHAAPGFLLGAQASAAGSNGRTVQITVTGRVPTLVPGLQLTVSQTAQAPVERFTTP